MWILYLPVVALFTYAAYNRFFHPLAKVPGPFWASITPLWLAWQGYKQRRPRLDLALHRRYGSIVRISPDEVMFANPEHFRAVYGAGTTFTKARFYEATQDRSQPRNYERLDMLTETDIEKLRFQKRLAGPVYATANIKRHQGLIDANIQRFVKRLGSFTARPVNIYHEIELLAVDTMCELTFGQPFGAVEAGSDGGHMASFDVMWAWWGWIGYLPWLNALDKRMPWNLIFNGQQLHMPVFPFCIGKMGEYQKAAEAGETLPPGIHDDLRKLSKQRSDFLYNWGTRLSMTDLGAGVDTSSWTMAAFIVGVSSNPAVYARLRAEFDAAVAEGRLRPGEPAPYDEAARLEYFQACLQETLRVWPNIAISVPRIVPKDGILIDGHFIPAGYTVGMNSKQLGLNEQIFGADADVFRPERWLDVDRARRNDMETRNLSFGGPSRKCPGMHMIGVVLSKVLPSLYLNFDTKILNELDGAPGPGGRVWLEKGSFPTKWEGLEIELTRR